MPRNEGRIFCRNRGWLCSEIRRRHFACFSEAIPIDGTNGWHWIFAMTVGAAGTALARTIGVNF